MNIISSVKSRILNLLNVKHIRFKTSLSETFFLPSSRRVLRQLNVLLALNELLPLFQSLTYGLVPRFQFF